MVDIRQSPQFARFMTDLGWEKNIISSNYIYLRKFFPFGYFAKIPRPKNLFPVSQLISFKKKNRIFRLKVAPFIQDSGEKYENLRNDFLNNGFVIENSPFNPTTTIQFDLSTPIDEIFNNFSEAKRRGVRRALKNEIIVRRSEDINTFIKIRKKQYAPMGFLFVSEMKKIWSNFYPNNATLLIAYQRNGKEALAGILLLYYDKIAYYWFASAYEKGKKLFAPTLLVYESLKAAKAQGSSIFDFEGICDERFPKASESWKGFTKFKEGFGGEKIVYCENFYL